MADINDYGFGWAFYKSGGIQGGGKLPEAGVNLREWIGGYAAALADYDPTGDAPSIEAALRTDGVTGELLERLLQAAESIEQGGEDGGEFVRWPGIPVRHSITAEHERDYRIARNSGLLTDEEAAVLYVPGAIIV